LSGVVEAERRHGFDGDDLKAISVGRSAADCGP
jgi:hypothetical protein